MVLLSSGVKLFCTTIVIFHTFLDMGLIIPKHIFTKRYYIFVSWREACSICSCHRGIVLKISNILHTLIPDLINYHHFHCSKPYNLVLYASLVSLSLHSAGSGWPWVYQCTIDHFLHCLPEMSVTLITTETRNMGQSQTWGCPTL